MGECFCHFRTNHISSVTQILEGFNPDYASSLNRVHKDFKPQFFSIFEKSQRKGENRRGKDEKEVNESNNMRECWFDFFPSCFWIFYEFWIHWWSKYYLLCIFIFLLRGSSPNLTVHKASSKWPEPNEFKEGISSNWGK